MEKIRMTIRVVPELDRKIKAFAEENGISKNAVILEACRDFLQKKKCGMR